MASERPNIILIITDQQRYDTIAALGFDYARTPNLDRLVETGVTFTQCHITAPSCAPARASLFTGCYPHTTGVFKNGDAWPRSWIQDLADSGYQCVNVGKMHTQPFDAPVGFHQRYIVENKDRPIGPTYFTDQWELALRSRGYSRPNRDRYAERPDFTERLGAFEWELPEELHPDMFVGDLATWWIDQYRGSAPFFLEVGFPGPHPPYDPTQRFIDTYADAELPLLDVTDADLQGQPPPFHALMREHAENNHDACRHDPRASLEQRRRQRAYYMANVTMIDEKVGQILDALDRRQLENTLVIFTSDHGDCLGDHGHSQKWTMYDTITRVPLVFWSSRGDIASGRRDDGLCQLMDVGPTILELAGVEARDAMEATSLVPQLRGEPCTEREYVFAEHGRDNLLRETAFMTMVRGRRHKLVHFLNEPFGQLFDLEADPDEMENLWDDPQHASVKAALLDVMREWLVASNMWNAERLQRERRRR